MSDYWDGSCSVRFHARVIQALEEIYGLRAENSEAFRKFCARSVGPLGGVEFDYVNLPTLKVSKPPPEKVAGFISKLTW